MMEKDFNSNLNPLSTCLELVGIPLNSFTKKNREKCAGKVVFLLVAIVSANLFINGPRGLEIDRLKFLEKIYADDAPFNDSPYLYLKLNPFAIVKLVKIIAEMIFFCYVPFIHFTFVAMIFFDPNWKKLIGLLDKIQREMKLNDEFHCKCSRICLAALFQLVIVS